MNAANLPAERTDALENVNVVGFDTMPTPAAVHAAAPLTEAAARTVEAGRAALRAILERSDRRPFVVVGPCSIHDPAAAMDYARRLKALADGSRGTAVHRDARVLREAAHLDRLEGMVNDPRMNDSFHIEEGIKPRAACWSISPNWGCPLAPRRSIRVPQYLGDLVTWNAIGARTTESQTHREMASGLSTPGRIQERHRRRADVAVNAILSVSRPHSFLGINAEGSTAIIRTRATARPHRPARRRRGPNYDSVTSTRGAGPAEGAAAGQHRGRLQPRQLAQGSLAAAAGADRLVHQIMEGNRSIVGMMLESHLHAGNQTIPADLRN